VQIDGLKELRDDLIKIAKLAEKEKDFKIAKEIWAQCVGLSSQLFQAGIEGERDNVKKFTALENKY
jgi:hypothetical protein